MSFYSYKNSNQAVCPGAVTPSNATAGLCERVCVQVKKVYDSALFQKQINDITVTATGLVPLCCNGEAQPPIICPPITFESCRSSCVNGLIKNLTIDRLCDRPNFARVRCTVDIPIDILFTDANCNEGIAQGIISVTRDVVLFIPDESIVPFMLESLVSAICVNGSYIGDNKFRLTVCVTIILKVVNG